MVKTVTTGRGPIQPECCAIGGDGTTWRALLLALVREMPRRQRTWVLLCAATEAHADSNEPR